MRFWVAVFLFLPTLSLAQGVSGGWENGNAGDVYVSEFILSARDVLQRLEILFENDKPAFDSKNLRFAIAATEVVSEEHVFLNGFERDAVNYAPAQRLIKLNRSRWRELRRSTGTKNRLRLVLHEYLWIADVDDTNFTVSEHLIELLKIENFSPTQWWNPVNPVNYVDARLSEASPDCAFKPGHFDVKKSDDSVMLETTGDCGDNFRKVKITKTTGVTPPSSHVRGFFHRYEIMVFDKTETLQGQMIFEPEWGECLLPENGACHVSGKMTIGEVELSFWFMRD